MGVIQEFFNNREIAIGIWVIIGLAVILPTKPARQFIKTAIPILFCKKFVIFYIVFLSFLGLVLFALNWAGLWDLTLLKGTVFWVLFVELPLFANAIEKADGGRFFSNLIRENVAIVVAIEFFVGFWAFSLITEIILIPLTVLISVLQVLAGQDKKHRSAKRFFDGLLVLWGIILLINAIYSLIHAPNQFLSFDTLKSLLLPLVLLVFNLPVVYGLALYNTYEQIFIRIKGSKSEQVRAYFLMLEAQGLCVTSYANTTRRFNQEICDFINTIHGDADSMVEPDPNNQQEMPVENSGVYMMNVDSLREYCEYYHPIILRYDKKAKVGFQHDCDVFNYGGAKGATYERVVIIPVSTTLPFIERQVKITSNQTRAKFYVACTRAKHSVVFAMENPCENGVFKATDIHFSDKSIPAYKFSKPDSDI